MNNNLYTLSLDSIKYILGLIRDTVDLPANILDDLHIQSTTTYSSYRLDTLLKALKEENIQYCDEAISKLNKLSKEIITDKLQITNENTIYLLLTDPVNNVYEQWLLINGTPQMIGTTEMKLDSVYTKDEADDRYALLADFNTLTTSFNNLVTSVEKKIDKDNIVTVLDDTVTDEQVPSAKVVYDKVKDIRTNTVADVPFTTLEVNDWASGSVTYTVENGVCYLWINGLESSTMSTNSQTIVSNLPKSKRGGLWCNITSSDCTKGGLLVTVSSDGELQNYSGLNNTTYFGTFSYPVAK